MPIVLTYEAGINAPGGEWGHLDFEAMNRAIALNNLRPVIDQAFSFEEAKDAYHYLAGSENLGKVIISGS